MEIISRESLLTLIRENNLKPIAIQSFDVSNEVLLDVESIDDFLAVIKEINPTHVYYKYDHYDKNDFLIPTEWYSEYSSAFKAEVRKQNEKIEAIDFTHPSALTLFSLLNGTFVGMHIDDEWLEKMNIVDAEEQLEELEQRFFSEVSVHKAMSKQQRQSDVEELRKIILASDDFKHKKNQGLRELFLIDLLDDVSMERFTYLFNNRIMIKLFMDETWSIYQEKKQ